MAKGHKHVSIDAYAYQSGMQNYNAAYKVLFAIGALLTVIVADRVEVSVMTAVYTAVLVTAVGKVHLHDYIRLMLIPAAFIFLSGFAIAIQTGEIPDAVCAVHMFGGTIGISREGVYLAARVGLKAFGAVSALYLMTLTVPMGEILMVLGRLHVPGILLDLMHLIYRYIFLLTEQHKRQRDAATARLGYHGYRNSMRTFGAELANLFILSMQKANAYYDAMEARGYDGKCCFWEEKKPFSGRQLIPALGYILLAAALLIAGKWS